MLWDLVCVLAGLVALVLALNVAAIVVAAPFMLLAWIIDGAEALWRRLTRNTRAAP